MLKVHMEHSHHEHTNLGIQAHAASMVLEDIPQGDLSFHSFLHIQKHALVGCQSVLLGQLKWVHLSMMGLSGGVSRSSSSQYSLFT